MEAGAGGAQGHERQERQERNRGGDDALARLLRELAAAAGQQGGGDGGARQTKANQDFLKYCPPFDRNKDRWIHFARTFRSLHRDYPAEDLIAKRALYRAIKGPSAILVSSMDPDEGLYLEMTLAQYLQQ